jgi:hypothetical protein
MANTKDRDELVDAIRNNLSPFAVVAIAEILNAYHCDVPENLPSVREEVKWFSDILKEMVGMDEFRRLLHELKM